MADLTDATLARIPDAIDAIPAVVETVLSRVPLRWVVRVSVRSCGAAPITAVASASTKAWSMKPSI